MQGTREHVLEIILQRREARVEELALELGITTAAVRRHLDHLRADGLVEVKAVRQATGRPYYAYHATELAAGTMPAGYAALLERVLLSVAASEDLSAAVTEQIAETVASRHRGEVPSASAAGTEDRVEHVTESLRQEGILESWRTEADGFHLVNGLCPYRKAAEVSRLPCESDRIAIEKLLGQEVLQLQRIVDGAPTCEYVVSHER